LIYVSHFATNIGGQEMISTAASLKFPCATCEVRDTAICAALDYEELRQLNAIATSVSLHANQTVFFEDDKDAFLFNIVEGAVRLSKMLPDGRRQITGFLFPGDLLGLSVAGVYAYTAEAIIDTSLCRFDRVRLAKLSERFPKLEHQLLSLASNELVQAQDHLMILGQKSASERVATILLRLAERIGQQADDGSVLDLPMTREDLADFCGLTLETVSRNISLLRKKGIIEVHHSRRIHILKTSVLTLLSGDI
jgi:CRP/FNR family transcriptional regulator